MAIVIRTLLRPRRPVAPQPPRDLLQRHLLCQATGLHDRGRDDRCRDCGVLLDASAPTCAHRNGEKP